jgi:tetratricopeptide (TPR) repeat protein
MLLKPGDLVDEFRILEVIGDGGFSVIYKAEDTELERLVAVKQLYPTAFVEAGVEERFIREAKLAASLNHPNIVSIYALKRQANSLFLVMEYLDGGSVRDLLNQEGYLPQNTLLRLANHVCTALAVLHSRDIIHRDIKPENILYTEATGNFKVADFGLAHMLQADWRRSSSGPQSGTVLYMSPEQAAGHEITAVSDIYSFATVLYEALTGSYYLALENEDNRAINHILNDAPLPPSTINPRISEAFDEPLLRALSKDPAERYQSAVDFLTGWEKVDALARRNARANGTLTPEEREEISAELYRIRTLRELGEPEQAMARLNVPWVRDSGLPEVLAERGETLIAQGDPMGYELLEQAVAEMTALPFAQIALAEHYAEQGDSDAYNIAMIDAIEADADLVFATYYERLIDSIARPEEFWVYVDLFRAARPSCQISFNLGRILTLIKGYEHEAIAAFEAALSQAPNFGPAQVALGSTWLTLGAPSKAIAWFEGSMEADFPQYAEDEWHKSPSAYRMSHAYLGLAIAYANAGQMEPSVQAALSLLEHAPETLDEHCHSLVSLYSSAAQSWLDEDPPRNQEVCVLLLQALPLADACSDGTIRLLLGTTQILIGTMLRDQGDKAEGIAWLESALETFDDVPSGVDTAVAEQIALQVQRAKRELKVAKRHR